MLVTRGSGAMKKWQIVGITSVVFIIGLVMGLMLPYRLLDVKSSSVRLTVERDVETSNGGTSYGKEVRFNDVYYRVSYGVDGDVYIVGVFGDSSFHETFPAEAGSKFTVFGMEGIVSEVYDSHVVVLVKPI
jgi:hypothetical protein